MTTVMPRMEIHHINFLPDTIWSVIKVAETSPTTYARKKKAFPSLTVTLRLTSEKAPELEKETRGQYRQWAMVDGSTKALS
jgi:hypothetical protein